jgi:chromosome segregation ATPase
MSDQTQSVFAQQAHQSQDPFVQKAVQAIDAERETAHKILSSAQVLFTANAFPAETNETEKEVLKNSLRMLNESMENAKKNAQEIQNISAEKYKKAEEEIKKIEHDFEEVSQKMLQQSTAKKEELETQEAEIVKKLEEIKQQYETKKQELEEKQKEIIAAKKELAQKQASEQNMAKNALQKALEEGGNTELSREEIEQSAHVFEALQKNINRAKGSLELIFSDPNQKEILEKILSGNFSAVSDIAFEEKTKATSENISVTTQK